MTPDQVKLMLYEVLGTGVFLNSYAFVIFVCGSLLAVAISASAGAFFGKLGETAAIRRDLERIKDTLAQTTAVTEEIKANISGALWLKQKRWDAKWECYTEIVGNLGEVYGYLTEAM